jgi:hypothetical protein
MICVYISVCIDVCTSSSLAAEQKRWIEALRKDNEMLSQSMKWANVTNYYDIRYATDPTNPPYNTIPSAHTHTHTHTTPNDINDVNVIAHSRAIPPGDTLTRRLGTSR